MKMRMMACLACLLLAACSDGNRYAQAICVLVDVSGTYADQKPEVVDIVKKGILPGMLPGDTLILMRIDSQSYEKANVEASVSLDPRPSHANAQKLGFAKQLDRFARREGRARFTDIRGALMLAADYLKETTAGTQTIVVFSDLKEDLPGNIRRELSENEFENIRVVAANVKQLRRDNADPAAYRQRLASWEDRVLAGGARDWRVIVDSPKLVEYIERRL
ncbi:MAG: VWA domain-containing protein [Candidatus Krumholzibacteriia bacterium]